MKILMVLENKFPTDERVEKEALSLIKVGHEVHLLCASLESNFLRTEDYKGIKIHRVKSTPFYYNKARVICLTTPFYFNFWFKHTLKLVEECAIDVVHIHDLPLAEVGIRLRDQLNVRLVVDFHENYPYMLREEDYIKSIVGRLLSPISLWIEYEKKVLNRIDNAVCVCEEMRHRMKKLSSRPNYKVLDNTIDLERWPKLLKKTFSETEIKAVYVGGFTRKRGIEVAIKGIAIFNKSQEKKASLDLYGSGKRLYIDSLLMLADSLGLADKVLYKGYIKLPQDAEKLGNYDVGLIPHLRNMHTDNTSPNKIFQYLYYHLPNLCSDCNYLVRLINETQGGLNYKDTSPEDFAKKLEDMTSGNSLSSFGNAGFESITKKYNWARSVEELVLLYQELV